MSYARSCASQSAVRDEPILTCNREASPITFVTERPSTAGFHMPRFHARHPHSRSAILCATGLLTALSLGGCATSNCDTKAREAEASFGPKRAADVRAKCEKRLADMRQRLKSEEDERKAAERRDAFINRASGQASSRPRRRRDRTVRSRCSG